MKSKLLYLFLTIIFGVCTSNAVEIVYPKSEVSEMTSETTFFIGHEDTDRSLKINSEPVELHSSGGFLYPVKLNLGENIFTLDNGSELKEYKIIRKEPELKNNLHKEVLFQKSEVYLTAFDNVPLRSTPYDYGLNRLQNLEKGLPLHVIGEFGDFFKVRLARDDYVWVDKTKVVKSEMELSPVRIESFVYNEDAQKRVFTVKLTKKVPYILSEGNGLDLVIYNVKGYPENKYEFHINKLGKLFGYKSYYKNNNELVIEVKTFPSVDKENPLKGLNITLDAGHGGSENGAIGCLGDKEKDINLSLVLKLKPVLEAAGANVFLTREYDDFVSLADRVSFSKSHNSDIFLSFHNNALPDSQAFSSRAGVSVFYFYPQSRALGVKILECLCSLGLKNDKVRRESFAVVRNSDSLAVLVEVAYLINPEDNAKLRDVEFQQKVVEAVKQGLERYLNDL